MAEELYGPVGGGGGFGPGIARAKFIETPEALNNNLVSAADLTAASFSCRPIFQPFYMDGVAMNVNTVRVYLSRTAGVTLNATMGVGLYTMGNSTSLALVSSAGQRYSLTASSEWSGLRAIEFTGLSNMVLTQGQWFLGFHVSASNTSTAVAQVQLCGIHGAISNVTAGTVLTGNDQSVAPAASNLMRPFDGVYSATTAVLPASVGASEMLGSNSNQAAQWYALIKEI